MPAIQSAMTDHLAFSGEFADRLEQGAVAQDFATHEHTMSPEAAREQVADGTSVLAVILPEDLSPTFVRQAAEYGRGERSDPPDPVTLTIVAGPQALAQDEFILSQYRSQVLTQASEHIAEQMRIVSRKLNAEVDRPVRIVVEESDGPEPQDLLFASQSEASSADSDNTTGSADSAYANAGPEAREAAVAQQIERSYAVGAALAAIVLAAAEVVGSFAAWVAAALALLYNWVPGVVTAAALTVAVLIVAHLIVRGYDRRVSTRTALV